MALAVHRYVPASPFFRSLRSTAVTLMISITVEGTVTVTVAILGMLILPDLPSSSTFSGLTSMQHDFAIWRLQKDVALRSIADRAVADRGIKKIGVWEAFWMVLVDRKIWIFCGILTSTCEFYFHQ